MGRIGEYIDMYSTVKPVGFIERWSLNTGQNILLRYLWDITEWPLNTGGL